MASFSLDQQLFSEKSIHRYGTAKIQLANLAFSDDNKVYSKTICQKQVNYLVKAFELEGCLRLPIENHVHASIDNSVLASALEASNLKLGRLQIDRAEPEHLELPDGVLLNVLHGRHRLSAGLEHLWPTDRWWVVELYSSGQHISSILSNRPC